MRGASVERDRRGRARVFPAISRLPSVMGRRMSLAELPQIVSRHAARSSILVCRMHGVPQARPRARVEHARLGKHRTELSPRPV